jgi:3-dehydroquinate synthase
MTKDFSFSPFTTLTLDLGARSYPIVMGEGVLMQAGSILRTILSNNRVIIVTDTNIAPLYLASVESSLSKAGFAPEHIILPHGETTKSFFHFEGLLNEILSRRPDRKTALIALGGGVMGDITGFAASVLLRGMPFIQIPTTLLAQVDSSVGGKTAINSPHGKNLIGAFYQPKAVLADLTVLRSLPQREFLAGYAEVLKYGLIDDPEFFEWLETHATDMRDGKSEALLHAVHRSCAAKARIVQADEHEGGVRALLNLGHTFGHALEKETGYSDTLLHGEAVALGMLMALHLSATRGICAWDAFERTRTHLNRMGMPTSLQQIRPQWDVAQLVAHCYHDKKSEGGVLTFILLKGIGKAFITKDVTAQEATASFEALI